MHIYLEFKIDTKKGRVITQKGIHVARFGGYWNDKIGINDRIEDTSRN